MSQINQTKNNNEESKGEITNAPTTTTFVDDGTVITSDYTSKTKTHTIPTTSESIPEFLAKPLYISSTQWTTASVQGTTLTSFSIGTTLTGNTYWASKIEGFNLIRGTAVIRVQINANPFQAGKLICHFLPEAPTGLRAMRNTNITTKTQQPNAILDCRDAVAEIRIPYIAPSDWYDKIHATYDWGNFYVSVLSPLVTGSAGETAVDMTIYMYFDDFELAAPMVNQSNGGSTKKYKARVLKKGSIEAESVVATSGPLTQGLLAVGEAAGALGTIPFLSGVMKPASWVSAALSQVTSYLGWSKPRLDVTLTPIVRQTNRFAATSDGVDVAVPLALRSDNLITVSDLNSIRNEDEMSFSFLRGVSANVWDFAWTTSQLAGTSVFSQNVGPNYVYRSGILTSGASTITYKTGPPIFYMANMFRHWRGGIKVKFLISKTEFHTGRLQITWTPTDSFSTSPTLATGIIAMREIVDLRCSDEFEITLPYYLYTNYIQTGSTSYSGHLDVVVLNELKCPETASSTINIHMFVSGADDFEFANPGQMTDTESLPFYNQGACDELNSGVPGGLPTGSVSSTPAEMSQGEMFVSIKQILSRYCPIYLSSSSVSAGSALAVWPWLSGMSYASAGAIAYPNAGGDPYSMLAPMYNFYRGSVRLTLNLSSIAASPVVAATLTPGLMSGGQACISAGSTLVSSKAPFNWFGNKGAGFAGVTYSDNGIGSIAVSIPYTCRTKCSTVAVQTLSDDHPYAVDTPLTMVNFNSETASFSDGYRLARSFGDEFTLSYFLGCPPVYSSIA